MSNNDGATILTAHELYAAAELRELEQLPCLFPDEILLPKKDEMPYILSAMAEKAFIEERAGKIALTERLSRLMDCYAESRTSVAMYFYSVEPIGICCACCRDRILCAETLPRQPGALKLYIVSPDALIDYLSEEELLDEIPAIRPPHTEPEQQKPESGTRTLLRIDKYDLDGSRTSSEVYTASNACLIMQPDGSITHGSRTQAAELIKAAVTVSEEGME